MTAASLLALIESLIAAVPNLVTLFGELKSGATVTEDQIETALAAYTTARAQLAADIAAEKAAGD
jgi:hypothetical protein